MSAFDARHLCPKAQHQLRRRLINAVVVLSLKPTVAARLFHGGRFTIAFRTTSPGATGHWPLTPEAVPMKNPSKAIRLQPSCGSSLATNPTNCTCPSGQWAAPTWSIGASRPRSRCGVPTSTTHWPSAAGLSKSTRPSGSKPGEKRLPDWQDLRPTRKPFRATVEESMAWMKHQPGCFCRCNEQLTSVPVPPYNGESRSDRPKAVPAAPPLSEDKYGRHPAPAHP